MSLRISVFLSSKFTSVSFFCFYYSSNKSSSLDSLTVNADSVCCLSLISREWSSEVFNYETVMFLPLKIEWMLRLISPSLRSLLVVFLMGDGSTRSSLLYYLIIVSVLAFTRSWCSILSSSSLSTDPVFAIFSNSVYTSSLSLKRFFICISIFSCCFLRTSVLIFCKFYSFMLLRGSTCWLLTTFLDLRWFWGNSGFLSKARWAIPLLPFIR